MSDTNSTLHVAVNDGLGTQPGNAGGRVNVRQPGPGGAPPVDSYRILLQDGSGYIELQDSGGVIELQVAP